MSYNHQRISSIAIHQESLLNARAIPQELTEFCLAVTKSMRGVKTTPRTLNSAWVYMEGEDMAMGYIGYGDFQTSRAAASKKYAVYARGIRNMKYNDMNEQHFMRVALKMDVALKHAKAYLINYSTSETAQALYNPAKVAVRDVSTTARMEYRKAKEDVGLVSTLDYQTGSKGLCSNALERELGYLMLSGHVFSNPELSTAIQDMLAKKKVFSRFAAADAVPMDFVRAYTMSYGEQRVDTVRVKDISSYRFEVDRDHNRTWLAKELPEELMGHIAVMSMCEDGDFVEDVGYKVSENMFYLYVEDVTT